MVPMLITPNAPHAGQRLPVVLGFRHECSTVVVQHVHAVLMRISALCVPTLMHMLLLMCMYQSG